MSDVYEKIWETCKPVKPRARFKITLLILCRHSQREYLKGRPIECYTAFNPSLFSLANAFKKAGLIIPGVPVQLPG